MSGVEEQLLGDAEVVLRRESEKLRGGSCLDRLLASWLLPDTYGGEANAVAFAAVSHWRETKQGGGPRSYQSVGALALATRLNVEDSERRTAFNEGLDWALGTSPEVDGAPVGLAADPAAVLAVVSALLRTGDQARQGAVRSWLSSVLDKFGDRLGLWERAQLHIASQLLGEHRNQPSELDDACCVTRVAVAPPGKAVAASDARIIVGAVLDHYAQVDAIGAALLLASLARTKATVVRSIRTDAMTVDDVLAVLRNIPRSLRDWTWEEKARTKTGTPRQWHVDHEYHVQDLLWVVLAPLFVDIESEGYSKKVGFTQPRADLVIPSLELIIEAKFARASDSLKEIQRQLAQDAAMYFPHGSPYDRMIAFVWDDAARTEEHATLIQGLEKLNHVAGVVVVSRPAKMRQAAGAAPIVASGGQDT
ncbi:hypothetical protein WMF27_05960 [Sorangium sp. So ce281]|uniref:PD-(D/E)XK nuclease domain-containing protein n=1 Tax=unclassified Sorangium TaxID=2621164 RepID=UPI003F5FBA16